MKNAKYVLSVLASAGFEAYLVGGCVRDLLLGKTPCDFDIATNALPNEIIEAFSNRKLNLKGLKHGTVSVIFSSEMIEITTYRIDGKYTDSRHPQSVSFTPQLALDLARRDFTVNAMAMSAKGEIIDLHGGRADLENKLIRTVGAAQKRFEEDALRIMRGLRFASQKDFCLEQETLLWANKLSASLKSISYERIFTELKKMLALPNAYNVMKETLPIFTSIFPTLNLHQGVWLDICESVKNSNCDCDLALGAILMHADMPIELERLKADNKLKKKLITLKQMLSVGCGDFSLKDNKAAAIYLKKLMQEYSPDAVSFLSAYLVCTKKQPLCLLNITSDALNTYVSIKELNINGEHLKQLGFRSYKIKKALTAVLQAVIEERCENTLEALLAFVKGDKEIQSIKDLR